MAAIPSSAIAEIIEVAAALAEESKTVTEQAWRRMDGLAERVDHIDGAFQSVTAKMRQPFTGP